ncbi:hypothetical protein HOM98_00955 [Candidatus Peregrinibacteria bacterium]|nr:hypothetical protein [Candidatus Peregrinibacteria bacterium]
MDSSRLISLKLLLLGLILYLSPLYAVLCQADGFTTTTEMTIMADEDISIPPQIVEILPLGHIEDPDTYHLQIQTEPLVTIYVTTSYRRTYSYQSDEQGYVWIELDLTDTENQSLEIVAMDYWGNSALTEVSFSKRANSTAYSTMYTELGRTGKDVQDLAIQLTSSVEESSGESMMEKLEIALEESALNKDTFSGKASGIAQPIIATLNSPIGYYSLLIGFSFIVIGLYFRATPLPEDFD